MLISVKSLASESVTHDAHVHGLSEMTIAIEKQTLEIQIESPAVNLVGFEHKAQTKKDIATVEKAKLLLEHHAVVFSLSGGSCKLVNQFIDVSSITNTHHHPEKEHKHEINHSSEISHSEVTAIYQYHCEKTSELSSITVTIFDLFPDIQEMQVMWISEIKQGAIMLNPTNKVVNLR